ncbi:MAG: CBS domain-containing protein [Clostridia bacterium]|nr:CBS domain-containing protein [Clostridia bacterium]
MNSAEVFLDLYKTLEDDLKEYYAGKKLKYSSPVYEFMNTDGRKYYDELDLCREIRNILSHHPYYGGEIALTPSDKLTETLKEIINYVENPVRAIDIATHASDLMSAELDDSVSSLLFKMEKKGISHVPVMKDGVLLGVFSVGAVFDFMRSRPGVVIDSSLTLSEMKDFLPVNAHRNEQYLFCDTAATLQEVGALFSLAGPRQRRVAAVFVVKGSDKGSQVKGMITPWDMVKVNN